jgi:hypothetical protein
MHYVTYGYVVVYIVYVRVYAHFLLERKCMNCATCTHTACMHAYTGTGDREQWRRLLEIFNWLARPISGSWHACTCLPLPLCILKYQVGKYLYNYFILIDL